MKPTLQLKLSQQLKLTPQLQQSIRLQQLSTIELNQEIERIVQENPLLELREEWDSVNDENVNANEEPVDFSSNEDGLAAAESQDDALADENPGIESEWQQDGVFSDNSFDDDREAPQIPDKPIGLREHLNFQTNSSQLSEQEKKIISLLIDSLDENGYLMQDLTELQEMLPAELGISLVDLEHALQCLQCFDPPGVGARSLKECLLLQLQAMPVDVCHRDQAIKVVQDYLEKLL